MGIHRFHARLANDVGGDGITANAVLPHYQHARTRELPDDSTERFGNSRRSSALLSPEDIAAPVAFLTSEDGAFITGQAIVVDGGHTKFPRGNRVLRNETYSDRRDKMSGRSKAKYASSPEPVAAWGARRPAFHPPGRYGGSCDISEANGLAALEEVNAGGRTMVSLQPCDLTKPSNAGRRRSCDQDLRRIDVLYNNAAKAYFNWIEDVSEKEWRATINEESNLVFLSHEGGVALPKKSGGTIVNTASATAWTTFTILRHCA